MQGVRERFTKVRVPDPCERTGLPLGRLLVDERAALRPRGDGAPHDKLPRDAQRIRCGATSQCVACIPPRARSGLVIKAPSRHSSVSRAAPSVATTKASGSWSPWKGCGRPRRRRFGERQHLVIRFRHASQSFMRSFDRDSRDARRPPARSASRHAFSRAFNPKFAGPGSTASTVSASANCTATVDCRSATPFASPWARLFS